MQHARKAYRKFDIKITSRKNGCHQIGDFAPYDRRCFHHCIQKNAIATSGSKGNEFVAKRGLEKRLEHGGKSEHVSNTNIHLESTSPRYYNYFKTLRLKRFYFRSIFLLSAEADLAFLANVNAFQGTISTLLYSLNPYFCIAIT